MKKNLIFMLSLLMTLTTAFVLSSCEKEDGEEEVIKDRAQWGKSIVGNWVSLRTVPGSSTSDGKYNTTFDRTLVLNADGTGSWVSKETTVYLDDNSSKDYSTKFSFTWTYEYNESAIYPSSLNVKVTSSESGTFAENSKFDITVYEVTKNSLTFYGNPFGMYEYKRK